MTWHVLPISARASSFAIGQRRSSLGAITPQGQVLAAILLMGAIVLTPHRHWWAWGTYGGGLYLILIFSRVSLQVLGRQVAVEMLMLTILLVGVLFQPHGQPLWRWGMLQVTQEGVTLMFSVMLKTLLCLTTANLLIRRLPLSKLMQALTALRVPPLMVAIIESTGRYLHILRQESTTMGRAALARNLLQRPQWHRLVVGHMVGALFIRTYDRAERIHQAMLARGYRGHPSHHPMVAWTIADLLLLCIIGLWIILAQVIGLWGQAGN